MTFPVPLIAPQELAPQIEAVRPLDARVGPQGRAAYERAHLRGAVYADLERDLSVPGDPAAGGRHPLPPLDQWARRLGDWGIGPDTPVVVYDDQGGMLAAARAWWMLRAVGHERVAVVDGGWQAIVDSGLPTDAEAPDVRPRAPYPATEWTQPLADADMVEQVRNDPAWRVIDARAAERYRGESEPVDPVAGHIPGAINLHCASSLDERQRFKTPENLAAQFRTQLGDVPPQHVVVHCGSGVTACHTLLALEHAGLHGAALYVGSWSEWCRRPERPREP